MKSERGNKVFSKIKGFTVENDIWEKEENLVDEFDGRIEAEVR